ncbi:transcription initiation factor IIF, beta subunit [Phakopsora pachyrhizi]|nr:transcription initiation factor IIF, beta subunit [Phakopsora pachyrhizi]
MGRWAEKFSISGGSCPGLTPLIEEEDCDEDLDLEQMDARTWLVKVPKFLSERWQQHAQIGGAGVELARMRVHNEGSNPKSGRKIEIILTEVPELPDIPTNYTLDVRNHSSFNLYVFDELAKPEPVPSTSNTTLPQQSTGTTSPQSGETSDPSTPQPLPTSSNPAPSQPSTSTSNLAPPQTSFSSTTTNFKTDRPRRVRPKVSRRPRIIGKIAHECLVSPLINDSYRAVVRARQLKAAQPKRTIQRVNEDLGTLNQMASGMTTQTQANKFAAFTRTMNKPSATEKFSRMPRTELLDALFEGFLRYQYWSMKSLRDQTKQPEAYLREVLSEIATLLKAGPYAGHWVLKPQYAELNRSKAAAKLNKVYKVLTKL